MITSDYKIKTLVENHSQQAKDTKPVGHYTKAEMIKLEHEWRLKLKSSGFSDIEMWDNKPKQKIKRINFIKGHIRRQKYEKYKAHVTTPDGKNNNTTGFEALKFWRGFNLRAEESFEYFRMIGLYAHHAPEAILPNKYRELLQEYALCGTYTESIRTKAPKVKITAVFMYLKRNINTIIKFVNQLENEVANEH